MIRRARIRELAEQLVDDLLEHEDLAAAKDSAELVLVDLTGEVVTAIAKRLASRGYPDAGDELRGALGAWRGES